MSDHQSFLFSRWYWLAMTVCFGMIVAGSYIVEANDGGGWMMFLFTLPPVLAMIASAILVQLRRHSNPGNGAA